MSTPRVEDLKGARTQKDGGELTKESHSWGDTEGTWRDRENEGKNRVFVSVQMIW